MYTFSSKLRLFSIVLLVAGLVLFGAGYMMNHKIDDAQIEQMMADSHKSGHNAPTHSHEKTIDKNTKDHADKGHDAHMELAHHQVHNRPWAALHTVAVFLFGLSACALFFYAI